MLILDLISNNKDHPWPLFVKFIIHYCQEIMAHSSHGRRIVENYWGYQESSGIIFQTRGTQQTGCEMTVKILSEQNNSSRAERARVFSVGAGRVWTVALMVTVTRSSQQRPWQSGTRGKKESMLSKFEFLASILTIFQLWGPKIILKTVFQLIS